MKILRFYSNNINDYIKLNLCLVCNKVCNTRIECGHYYHSKCFEQYLENYNNKNYKYFYQQISINDYINFNIITKGLFTELKFDNSNRILQLLELPEICKIINSKNTNGDTVFMQALRYSSNNEIINKLLLFNPDVNNINNEGYTPLMYYLIYSIKNGINFDIVLKLLSLGADINAKNNKGKTALMDAIELELECSIILKLINLGANINECDYNGKSILNYILETKIIDNYISLIIKLLELGIDTSKLNITDKIMIQNIDYIFKKN